MSNNVNINGATDRTSIKCHKIYKVNRESLNKRLLPESYFMRNIIIIPIITSKYSDQNNAIAEKLYGTSHDTLHSQTPRLEIRGRLSYVVRILTTDKRR